MAGVAGVAGLLSGQKTDPLKWTPRGAPGAPYTRARCLEHGQHVHMSSSYFILYILYEVINMMRLEVAKPRRGRGAGVASDFQPQHGAE